MERKRKITIVDDDRDTREMLTLALELEGFEVTEAANGLRLISTLHVDKPDAILLDVMMSWIDGFELCKAIKRNVRRQLVDFCEALGDDGRLVTFDRLLKG